MNAKRRFILAAGAAATLAPLALGRRAWWGFPLSHALLIYPTLRANSDWFGPVVTRFAKEAREVWLTIDDGPDPRDTPGILAALDRHDARATFFFIGQKATQHRELVRDVVRAGHGIGNHTMTHPQATFWALPPGRMRREIERGSDALAVASGRRPEVFRSPVGMTNPFVHPVLARTATPLVGWSASGRDGLADRGNMVVDRVMRRVRPGAIIVLHEGGAPGRVETMNALLARLSAEGWRCTIPAPNELR